MRLTVIGIGYLGLTHAVCMAELGHDVVALDVDDAKVRRAAAGESLFFEPGLEPLMRKNMEAGRLRFTTSWADVAGSGDVHFLCVGTPGSADGSADLRYVRAAAAALAPHLGAPCLIVGKSTVPVGTAREVAALIQDLAPAGGGAELAWSPEFLREGTAVRDSLAPDRLVFGVTSERSADLLREVYAAVLAQGTPALSMDLETAELVKVSANAFLATKISFINAMAEVCERVGADVLRLADALARDERIGGRFLVPGLGFGGGCLPKDVRAFSATARQLEVHSVVGLLGEVDRINLGRRARVVDLARQAVGGSLAGRKVAVLGLSFKPDSDDVRDSPSLAVSRHLASEGALVTAHDPAAISNAARVCPELQYADSVSMAAAGADVLLHLTDWADYRSLDPAVLATVVSARRIIDARCALDRDLWAAAGWSYQAPGRPWSA